MLGVPGLIPGEVPPEGGIVVLVPGVAVVPGVVVVVCDGLLGVTV